MAMLSEIKSSDDPDLPEIPPLQSVRRTSLNEHPLPLALITDAEQISDHIIAIYIKAQIYKISFAVRAVPRPGLDSLQCPRYGFQP